ncbi:MAG: UDP-N-acetylglucosamine 2-epimerase (non-hydrolyzing) [Bacteroidetes bacterium]|nr:UDP-N-acetylglucosamine 2-epimerase (non-hydrolyzing) [Bacteroidota bacterium]
MGKICVVVGTRPEIIKVAPVILEFRQRGFHDYVLINTGQHKDLSEPYWELFDLKPDYNLSVMAQGSSLGIMTSRAFQQLDELFNEIRASSPIDAILAQGDTTTVMVSSVLAFYRNLPFAHLEAGLRSFDLMNPFPEEFNRKVTSLVTQLHLAPTAKAKTNLLSEGVPENRISVIGNTVVDALKFVKNLPVFSDPSFSNRELNSTFYNYERHVLITCHRRENHGGNLLELIKAVSRLAKDQQDTFFIWPVHPNPNVRSTVLSNKDLTSFKNVLLVDPLEYMDVIKVLSNCHMVISDSGGIQEEAPSFRVPVLVFRNATERTEAIEAGLSKLVQANAEDIIHDYYNFKPEFGKDFENPFGDGLAAKRAVDLLFQLKM